MSVEATVRDFLTNDLGKDLRHIGPGDSLLEAGTIDSVAVMQLVAFLESTFGITVAEDDLMPENFDTIGAITAFVTRLQAGTRG